MAKMDRLLRLFAGGVPHCNIPEGCNLPKQTLGWLTGSNPRHQTPSIRDRTRGFHVSRRRRLHVAYPLEHSGMLA
jgi:hypothetical protein